MSLEKKAVLVVEDEPSLRTAVLAKLKHERIPAIGAQGADEAYALLEEHEGVRVVWLDHQLGGGDSGLSLVARIQGDPRFQRLTVCVVTNTTDPAMLQIYRDFGITHYYSKADTSLEVIVGELRRFLS